MCSNILEWQLLCLSSVGDGWYLLYLLPVYRRTSLAQCLFSCIRPSPSFFLSHFLSYAEFVHMLCLTDYFGTVLITLPSHMLTLKPPYTVLHKLHIIFNIMDKKKKTSTLDEDWQHFYQQPLWSSPHGGGDSNVCLCVCADVRVPFQYVFMLFEEGRSISRGLTSVMLLVDYAQHHPEPPPPCATAIIKMIYLTIGPRLRD